MKKRIIIEGMSCGHCIKHVEEALKEVVGVDSVQVSLAEKNAVVEVRDSVTDASLKEAVEEAGYDVILISDL